MTLHEEQERVQKAVSHSLSHVQEDPWLAQRVLANVKGEEPVKKKVSLALILCIVLGLAVMGTAHALFGSQVADFFGKYWNRELGEWLKGGKIAQIGETVSLGGVEFTLDEVIYRNRGIYAVGTARTTNEKDILLPMDLADSWEIDGAPQNEEVKALALQARDAGGRLLSVDCYPERIGVDGGSMVRAGDTGIYNLRNEDGSLAFCFETGGYALEDGKTYQVELWIDVDEWTADGRSQPDSIDPQFWTVSFEPVIQNDDAPAPVETRTENMQLTGFEIVTPAAYRETGTLPVYQAIENDFTAFVQPEWFNQSGIAEKQSASLTFNDHAVLQYAPEAIWYAEYTDELFDYNERVRETYSPDIEPMMLPRQALSMGIADIASSVYSGLGEYTEGVALAHDQLALLSLEDAERTAESLLARLGLEDYALANALDMSLERIQTLGEAYNRFWFEGEGFSNAPRQDFAAATAEDEGYFLVYTPLGMAETDGGRHQAALFVSSRGIVYANIRSDYKRGALIDTPARLITPEDAVTRLYAEIAQSLDRQDVKSIEQAILTYTVTRAENKKDGMVFVPAWHILYREEDSEYISWAKLNAVNGALIDAIFR